MNKPSFVEARITTPELIAAAAEEARLVVRLPRNGVVNFFIEGDQLFARVTPEQAEYLASIEGYVVDGYETKAPYEPPVKDWIAHGQQQYLEKQGRAPQQQAAQDPMSALLALFGGPEALLKAVAQGLAGQMPALQQTAQAQLEAEAQAKAEAEAAKEEALGWTYKKLQPVLGKDDALALLEEYDPAFNVGGAPDSAIIQRVATVANENHVLAARLEKLVK